MWQRLKDLVIRRILGLEDSPQRIAWGVFLGFVVAMTPTIGFQILLYVALATLLRVNKVAGIPILFISNPVSAVPLYSFCWWVGNQLLHGGQGENSWEDVQARLLEGAPAADGIWTHLLSAEFWSRVGDALVQLGGELWFGSLVLGVATGAPCYVLTLWGVTAYRRRSAMRDIPDAAWPQENERTTEAGTYARQFAEETEGDRPPRRDPDTP